MFLTSFNRNLINTNGTLLFEWTVLVTALVFLKQFLIYCDCDTLYLKSTASKISPKMRRCACNNKPERCHVYE